MSRDPSWQCPPSPLGPHGCGLQLGAARVMPGWNLRYEVSWRVVAQISEERCDAPEVTAGYEE